MSSNPLSPTQNLSQLSDLTEPDQLNELETLRHSTAHVMAHAISNLWPSARFGIGPAIDDGFYYDVDLPVKLSDEDLKKIEKEMNKVIARGESFVRQDWDVDQAIQWFQERNQTFKVEIIENLREKLGVTTVSTFTEGGFTDLCRGPHVTSVKSIKAFKLMSVAGAYWRGNEKNPQLQRIYGTSFFTQKELDEHLFFLEEAKRRDHRKLGRELDLFSFHVESPAAPFFHPKGTVVYNRLVSYVREMYRHYGYDEVITPQIFDAQLWHRSGHYENYKESMYFTEVDEREFAVKPMNCPAHTFIYASTKRSYRDLPLRLADFGRLHRYERSGVTAGLTRVRSFCQDDAHVFCTPDQIQEEIRRVVDMIMKTYAVFQFNLDEMSIALSTRPEKRVGSEEVWDKSEAALKNVLEHLGRPFTINAGDGAFYGPKIDFRFKDALKRQHQLATIQLDFNLPVRFGLEFTNSENQAHPPVMIHRAVLGSLERFMGVFIEHCAGAFPFWLAPIQARLIPIKDAHKEACESFGQQLKEMGIRFDIDDRNESMGLKTREAQVAKIPVSLVMGDREMASQSFALRAYGSRESQVKTFNEILAQMQEWNSVPLAPFKSL